MDFKRVFAVLVFPFFVACPTYAGWFSCKEQLSVETAAGYVSKVIRRNSFIINRDLHDYARGFHPDFKKSLNSLKPTDTWIDLGGGKGLAIQDYIISRPRITDAAYTVLVTYKLGRLFGIPDYFGKIKLLEGRLFEDIPLREIPRAKLMTDYYGVLSYTRDPSKVLRMIFDRLEYGGELYLYTSNINTVVDDPNGGPHVISFSTMLESISGIKVEGRYGILKITKISPEVLVPDLVLAKIDETSKPPFRRFRIINQN